MSTVPYITLPDYCDSSPAIQAAAAKLNISRTPARVNLPAIARRDAEFMRCWVADPGYVFVSSDFVSLEPSVTASFAEDPRYRYATYEGVGKRPYIEDDVLMIDDIYLMIASVMPGIGTQIIKFFSDPVNQQAWLDDSEKVKDNPIVKGPRKKAKPAALGFNYGMGPKRFVKQCYDAGITVTYNDALAMYKAYWKLFPGIQRLVQTLEVMIKKSSFIINPFGYRFTTAPHKAYNAFIQSSASGVLDVFMLKFFTERTDVRFVAPIHDEVIYQAPENALDELRQVQDRCVEELNRDLNFKIPMRLGFSVAKNFAEIK